MRTATLAVTLVTASMAASTYCMAGDIVYTPVNPSFGGNPFNSAHLMGLATSQNQFKPEPEEQLERSASERFVQMLQSRLYSALASKVSETIFGENAEPEGTFVFDDQEIHFVNDGDQISLTIVNHATGETTEISVPAISSSP